MNASALTKLGKKYKYVFGNPDNENCILVEYLWFLCIEIRIKEVPVKKNIYDYRYLKKMKERCLPLQTG